MLTSQLRMAGVTGLCQHASRVVAGDAFVAYLGAQSDGRDFIKEAISRGASALLMDPEGLTQAQTDVLHQINIPVFKVAHLADQLPELADQFYNHPSGHVHVVAVTGTNGKSSIAHGLNQMYRALDVPVAMIGTIGIGTLDHLVDNPLTTPDPCTLTRLLAEMVAQGMETVVMEASSHALDQGRLRATEIHVAIFTNLTQDHLDYHHTREAYGEAKARLYQMPSVETVVINLDDEWCREQLPRISPHKKVIGYTRLQKTHPRCDSIISAIRQDNGFELQEGDQCVHFSPLLIGDFNLSNLLAMIGALRVDGFALNVLATVAARVKDIPGRLECVSQPGEPRVIVDFAHTPDALLKALIALHPTVLGKCWCVFGCGGSRDATKRPIMGEIAASHADHVIITTDNARDESPQAIADMVLAGIPKGVSVDVILDRAQAIEYAIANAGLDDTILLAGKGHEKTQIIAGVSMPFSDQDIARRALETRRNAT